jgi:hypothetical protein
LNPASGIQSVRAPSVQATAVARDAPWREVKGFSTATISRRSCAGCSRILSQENGFAAKRDLPGLVALVA